MSPKLLRWQRQLNPAHRRVRLSRKHRFVAVVTVILFIWYRYSRPDSLASSVEAPVDSNIEKTYTPQRDISIPQVAPRHVNGVQQEVLPVEAPIKKSEQSTRKSPSSPIQNVDPHDDVQSSHVPIKQASPEYAGDDAHRKQAILGSQSQGDSEPSDLMPQKPPELVKQALEKLVDQHLTPAVKYDEAMVEREESASKQGLPKPAHRRFPSYEDYIALDEKGEALPDVVHMPFEDTTSDVTLEGWEDRWYSHAEFDISTWGNLSEPKIDFVYTCK